MFLGREIPSFPSLRLMAPLAFSLRDFFWTYSSLSGGLSRFCAFQCKGFDSISLHSFKVHVICISLGLAMYCTRAPSCLTGFFKFILDRACKSNETDLEKVMTCLLQLDLVESCESNRVEQGPQSQSYCHNHLFRCQSLPNMARALFHPNNMEVPIDIFLPIRSMWVLDGYDELQSLQARLEEWGGQAYPIKELVSHWTTHIISYDWASVVMTWSWRWR